MRHNYVCLAKFPNALPTHLHISNNVLASSLNALSIPDGERETLLSNPQSYLTTVSSSDEDRVRSILIPAYRKGFRVIFIVGAALCAVAFLVAFFMMPQVELKRADDDKLKEEGKKAMEKNKKSKSPA